MPIDQKLTEAANIAAAAAPLMDQFVNGDETTIVQGAGGTYPSQAKAAREAKDEIIARFEPEVDSINEHAKHVTAEANRAQSYVQDVADEGVKQVAVIKSSGDTQNARLIATGTSEQYDVEQASLNQQAVIQNKGDEQAARVIAEGEKAEQQADRAQAIADKFGDVDSAITEATEQADRSKEEADRSAGYVATVSAEGDSQITRLQTEGVIQEVRAKAEADRAKTEADKSAQNNQASSNHADRSEAAADLAEAIVYNGEASTTPAEGKIPIGKKGGFIDIGWIDPHYNSAAPNFIGRAGGAGFGVGICPELPAGFSPLPGCTSPTSDTYGNYRYTDGSIMCWVPLFYYRITGNSIEIAAESDYADNAAAEADNFALHRAFIDGSQVQRGFFVDKYMVSANNGVASSIKDGLPMSSHSAHNPYSQVGAPNNYGGSVEVCKTRGDVFFPASRFIHSAAALLSLAHGQGANNDAYCAWYDAAGVKNYPKGCNNNALGDGDDNTVKYVSDGYSNCGKTGSGSPFAKTAHNGQECGIADLNGLMYEVSIGITRPGTSSGDSTGPNPGDFWCLKESVRMADLTSGWNNPTDAWGDVNHVATLYDVVALPHIEHISNWVRFGNSENPVLSAETSGNGWMTTGLGIFQPDGGSSGGTNQFGRDGLYSYRRANLCLLSGGSWDVGSYSGVWSAHLHYYRRSSHHYVGCRAACYLS
ncbi:cell envelope integrity protein TolA [Endozoicomonas sp. GU-1]|uniref:cell envelope integrity protein TolA n=1 Tax=Endozoicomonas sp. GU-1 TaxID=3009078 RepID=UPI0022B39095|nr:cell envelope integrity protein TolA [Endozoicomonas sp. GU-1]WBA79545.1 cell envelope integrity protein TolA [Endozoicomonas sp. GU-1]